jgi:hypothetical protein
VIFQESLTYKQFYLYDAIFHITILRNGYKLRLDRINWKGDQSRMKLLRILFPNAYNKARFNLVQDLPTKKPICKHEVAYQFTCKVTGKDYFKMVNDLNLSAERAFAAQDIYAELEQKTDTLYHEGSYKAILEFLSQGKNMDAGMVAWNGLERIQKHITNWDLMYKLASVLYFDADENVYRYDVAYNEEKIKAWQQDKDIEGFFLKTGFGEYLRLFNSSGMNLSLYIQVQRKRNLQTLEHQLTAFSESEKKTELYTRLKSLVETLKSLIRSEK